MITSIMNDFYNSFSNTREYKIFHKNNVIIVKKIGDGNKFIRSKCKLLELSNYSM